MKIFLLASAIFLISALVSQRFVKPKVEKKVLVYRDECSDPTLGSIDSSKFTERKACREETILLFSKAETAYSKKVLDEVSRLNRVIQKRLKEEPESEEEIKRDLEKNDEVKKTTDHFKKYYPRFQINDSNPDDYLNFGIHTGDYTDASDFLGKRVCSNPGLYYTNFPTAYLSLFFSINNGRDYGGIVRIINEKFVTLIESKLHFSKDDYYFLSKRVPSAEFSSWVHEDIERDYKGFRYQAQPIVQVRYGWQSYLFTSPWLYNSCNKSISAIQNFCSLDPSFDMELKDFFYLSKFDVMLGNIYCKKSSDPSWTRIAIIEQVRI